MSSVRWTRRGRQVILSVKAVGLFALSFGAVVLLSYLFGVENVDSDTGRPVKQQSCVMRSDLAEFTADDDNAGSC